MYGYLQCFRLEEKMLLKWCRGLFFHIYHWNFASNFFLYCLTGEKFRGVVIEKIKKCKITLTSKISPKCLGWCKCDDRFKSIRTPSISLIKVVTFDETSINDNITTQRNGNDVASITWTISISTNRVEIFQIITDQRLPKLKIIILRLATIQCVLFEW